MDQYRMELLPLRYEHLLQLEALPPHHGDPFDRLLIAQAVTEQLPIPSADRKLKDYSVAVIW